MDFNIRQEQIKDYEAVHKVVELAFRDMEDSDHNEPFLVDQLRQTDAFIPELSLVAVTIRPREYEETKVLDISGLISMEIKTEECLKIVVEDM